jgi:hypothetical protein
MKSNRIARLVSRSASSTLAFGFLLSAASLVSAQNRGAGGGGAATASTESAAVPSDLKSLLAPARSEMRLVVNRYTADRNLLSGNYAAGGGAGGGGGRGQGGGGGGGGADAGRGRAGGGGAAAAAPGATPAPAPDSLANIRVAVAPGRIARLKRYDLAWQDAITKLDVSKFTPMAKADRDSLLTTIKANLVQLDIDAELLLETAPYVPFSPKLIGIIESRLRLEDVKSEASARTLMEVVAEAAATRAKLASGAIPAPTRRQAAQAARSVDLLRGDLTPWFNFYNTYDPIFSWWMGMPYQRVGAALTSYAAYLRDTATVVTAAPQAARPLTRGIEPGPAPKLSDVPDLKEIIALRQDEMADVVAQFFGRGGGGGTNAGRGGAAPAPRDAKYYRDWLESLKSLPFDSLSRNGQVDYLFIKKSAEVALSREGKTLPPATSNPRKTDNSGIPGNARGRDGLIWDLQDEMIPYTPEQLMVLADREFAWAEAEMKKASRQMGFGDDWKKAVEKTKTMHVQPGEQPGMIRDLIFEAIDYMRANNLVTVPGVVSESQRMSMMSPQAQLTSPFFLGGSQIQVSFPTSTMDFEARQQSMRGNNRPWSHATAHHEMVPGHNLVGYYNQRFSGYRANLGASTPFFGEGWPLYWELTLYDKGFNDTPEERVGALVWRMHRCARIIFSLKFHMGQWSPQEAVDFLVEKVGHERDNATAEVRRSFQGGYGPLYQAAYLLGGLQLRGLRKELVDSKRMTEKAFHDEILRQTSMPIALIRLAVTNQKLTRDMDIEWKFYGELPDR